jgi:uncharacterized protein YceK
MKANIMPVAVVLFAAQTLVCQAQTYTVLHDFKGGKDGAGPLPGSGAAFVGDSNGNLYGATAGGDVQSDYGTVFELSPPVGNGSWTETVLYRFKGGADGDFPGAALLPDGAGGFYSATFEGGTGTCAPFGSPAGCGTVFHLTPPANGKKAWKNQVLYTFQGTTDGAAPTGPLISDANGSLYSMTLAGGNGTCYSGVPGCGVVYRLDPPAHGSKKWTESVLYAFTGAADGATPEAGLTFDAAGNLYGVTSYGGNLNCAGGIGCGVVFKLTPPQNGKTWSETVLYTFQGGNDGAFPQPAPVFDSTGALLGTTSDGGGATACSGGCGTAYRLVPPKKGQTNWTETILHAFQGAPDGAEPNAGLTAAAGGGFVTTTFFGGTGACAFNGLPPGCGTVVELTPPAKGKIWTESVVHSLNGTTDGAEAAGGLLVDQSGTIYGAAVGGGDPKTCTAGAAPGCGTAFSITP